MANLDGTRRFSETSRTPRNPNSPTFEQLIYGDASHWPSETSPRHGRNHYQEEDHSPNKKSVLAKVKEKAKKLRHTFSGRKKHGNELHDDNTTPSWGVSLDDDEDDEDPEYLGAPMYESEMAPETYRETARQHPRAVPVVSESHILSSSIKHEGEPDKNELPSPNKTIAESMSEKLAPAYAAVSDATHSIASKIAGLTIEIGAPAGPTVAVPKAEDNTGDYATSGIEKLGANSETRDRSNIPRTWDKGVSVKEYLMHKLEPGEDERALSQVISEAISPRKSTGDMGVVEKVKDAVSSFLRAEEPSHVTSKTTNSLSRVLASANTKSSSHIPISATIANSSTQILASGSKSLPHIPISTNAHTVAEEENHGRILQAN